jgi:hypothetical protein
MNTIEPAAQRMITDQLRQWSSAELFKPIGSPELDDLIQARQLVADCRLQEHPFFVEAAAQPDLLRLWASQEAVVTGPFSQLLLLVASQLTNVHIRARFMNVVAGEHNPLHDNEAIHSHPWLLYRLCVTSGVNMDACRPLPPTIHFLKALASSLHDLMFALGALGIGNERMLITEYAAVRDCFGSALPTASYRAFLNANIAEDEGHTRIIEQVAASLAVQGHSPKSYLDGATLGVSARVKYYDELLDTWHKQGLPAGWCSPQQVDATISTTILEGIEQ